MNTLEFYTTAALRRLKRKRLVFMILICAVALAGLAACLWLLFTAGTLTAEKNELTVYAVNACAGASVILLYLNAVVPAKRAISHFNAVLAGDAETMPYTGGLTVAEKGERIPGGAAVRRVTVTSGTGTRRFFIYEKYARALASAGQSGVLQVSSGYITAVLPGEDTSCGS